MNCGQCGWTGMNCGNNCPKCRCTLRGPLNPIPTPPIPHPTSPCNRGRVEVCEGCDPCEPCESMVRICAFVVPSLDEGRWFRNSFIFAQDVESTYYISDNGDEIPFGKGVIFRDDFDPVEDSFRGQIVADFSKKLGYVFNQEGKVMSFELKEIEP